MVNYLQEKLYAPWYEIAIDSIGPWTVKVGADNVEFWAVTIIDTVTNLVEMIRIPAKPKARDAAHALEIGWLFRYPRPVQCIHDQGTEYTGQAFQNMLAAYGIHPSPISVKNPQANAICERMHQVVGNLLRTLLYSNPTNNMADANAVMDYALATASYAMRTTVHRTLGVSPGALVFHRDMILDLPFVADLLLLRDKRQALIDYNLRRENQARRNFDYQVGGYVLETIHNPTKLGQRFKGPYRIEQVHANGTITIRRTPHVTDRVNIRKFRPFHQ